MTNNTPRLMVAIGQLDRGGTEQHLCQVLPALARSGWRITVFVLRRGGALSETLTSAGVTVTGPDLPCDGLRSTVRAAIQLRALAHRERPDVVHFFLPPAYLLGATATLGMRIRRVMSRRSLATYQRRYFGVRTLEWWLHRRMDIVLANSLAVAAELSREGVPPERLGLLYNGVDVPERPTLRSDARTRLELGSDILVMVCVANLIAYKGHAVLLEALSRIRDRLPADWVVLMVGRDSGIGGALRAQSHDLDLEHHVRWVGGVPDVGDYLAAADIGVLASHEEGFSNAVLESMAAGLPMVVTDVGGNAEAVVDGRCGRVVPSANPGALAAALLELSVSPDLRRTWGDSARSRVLQSFNLSRCVALYRQLYENLAAGVPQPLPRDARVEPAGH
ncbi:MAG: glycosyltransferase [Gammaproteobacteria bacterium]